MQSKHEEFKLVPNSIQIASCEGVLNKIGSLLSSTSSECNTVVFNAWDKQGKMFFGKLLLTTAKTDSKFAKDARFYSSDLKSMEYDDEKENTRLFLGLRSINTQMPEGQTTEQLLSLEKAKNTPAKN